MNLSSPDDVRRLYEDSAYWYNSIMEQEIQLPIYHEVLGKVSERLTTVIPQTLLLDATERWK